MTAVKTVPQILDDAADLLEEEGRWTKGDWHAPCDTDENGISHCADGAIEYAAGVVTNFRFNKDGYLTWDRVEDFDLEAAYERAYQAASEYTRRISGGHGIVRYNDADGRTQDEVVAALRAAAAEQRARELVTA